MDSFQTTETIILRDYLAIERTRMANERTLLSFLRTGLYLIMTGFSMLELEALREISWVGYLALAGSAVSFVLGLSRFYWTKRRIKASYAKAPLFPQAE
jgi:putative membrane protein